MPSQNTVGLVNPVLERMRAGDVALGLNVRLARSGDIARIAKTTGHDFIFIDVQHSLFSLETIGHIAQAALRLRDCTLGPHAQLCRPGYLALARQWGHRDRLSRCQYRCRRAARG